MNELGDVLANGFDTRRVAVSARAARQRAHESLSALDGIGSKQLLGLFVLQQVRVRCQRQHLVREEKN